MTDEKLTGLERDILSAFHERYREFGFPPIDSLLVQARENTGAGRFTHLKHEKETQLPDGTLFLGKYSCLEVSGARYGATVSVDITAAKVNFLEIICNGDDLWDGNESWWRIADPETGDVVG